VDASLHLTPLFTGPVKQRAPCPGTGPAAKNDKQPKNSGPVDASLHLTPLIRRAGQPASPVPTGTGLAV